VSIALVAVAGCTRTPAPERAAPPRDASTSTRGGDGEEPATAEVPAALPDNPKRDSARLVKVPLVVPGFGDAVVVTPLELAEGKPLLVAAHGAGDGPDWQCQHWANITQGRFIVLCPRGLSLGRDGAGYYFPDHFALEREVLAAVDALEEALGPRLLEEGGVYAGYSQGATMGALMVVNHGRRFPHLLLVEGGSGDWSFSRARRFRESGGKSVAIVCGTGPCARRAKVSATVLSKVGLRARAAYASGAGHTYDGEVGEQSRALLDGWLLTE
jgi:pimeloyl-ACP methyl ester carboxylesterase